MRDYSKIKWDVTRVEDRIELEPVFPPEPGIPLKREQNYEFVRVFCALAIVAYLSVYFVLRPIYLPIVGIWFILFLSIVGVYYVYGTVSHLLAWFIDRLIRVIYTKPDDEEVPWTWVTRTGYSLKSIHGLVICLILALLPAIAGFNEERKRYSVMDGKVPGLEFTKSHGYRQHTLKCLLKQENPDPALLPSLVNIVEKEEELLNKGLAMSIIRKLYGFDSVEVMILEMKHLGHQAQQNAGAKEYIRACNSPKLVDAVIEKSSWNTKKRFMEMLAGKGDEIAVRALVRFSEHDKSSDIRAAAAALLLEMGNDAGVTAYLKLLEKEKERTNRMNIVGELGNAGDTRAIAPLINALNGDEHPWVRCYAAKALGRIGQETRVIDALMNAWESSDCKNVPHYAEDALRSILPLEEFQGWVRCKADGTCESHNPMRDPETARAIYEKKKDRYSWDAGERRFRILPDALASDSR
ncbi:MAG: HEAT repeat domain-containing protein [Planctomycetota bacterium]|jgi:HEAT repeat protein